MSGQKGAGAGWGGTGPGSRFPHARFRPGYVEAEVDELIDRIEATLAGTAVADEGVTAAEIRATMFSVTMLHRGYDEESVDNALDAYVERLSRR